MKVALAFLLIFQLIHGNSQPVREITIGNFDSLHSSILNENRQLLISIPKSHSSNKSLRYPIAYILDGDTYFHSYTGMIDFLSVQNGNSSLPEMIVVGIPNTNRIRDLTPSTVLQHAESGKAEKFTSFLTEELLPYIDNKYPTTSYRMLVGHSLGGLYVINTLVYHKDLFQSYLAIDPSLWWDNKKLLTKAELILKKSGQFAGKELFLATANIDDTAKAKNDTSAKNLPLRSLLQLMDILDKNKNNDLKFGYKFYTGENHGTIPLISAYDGLQFFFDFFKRPSFARVPDATFNADSVLKTHYERVSEKMGYRVLPPESLVNGIAWLYAINNVNSKAIHFYKLNVEYYPNSIGVYNNLARFYEDTGDVGNAILYFEKSLQRVKDPEIEQKIAELKAKKK